MFDILYTASFTVNYYRLQMQARLTAIKSRLPEGLQQHCSTITKASQHPFPVLLLLPSFMWRGAQMLPPCQKPQGLNNLSTSRSSLWDGSTTQQDKHGPEQGQRPLWSSELLCPSPSPCHLPQPAWVPFLDGLYLYGNKEAKNRVAQDHRRQLWQLSPVLLSEKTRVQVVICFDQGAPSHN